MFIVEYRMNLTTYRMVVNRKRHDGKNISICNATRLAQEELVRRGLDSKAEILNVTFDEHLEVIV
jgi:hypothetical protein